MISTTAVVIIDVFVSCFIVGFFMAAKWRMKHGKK